MPFEVVIRKPLSSSSLPPILFIHGAYHTACSWNVHFMPYFAKNGYESHAVTLHEEIKTNSLVSLDQTRLHKYLDYMLKVSRQFYRPPIIIAHSLGGLVALKYIERYPASAAVLLATPARQPLIPTQAKQRHLFYLIRHHPIALFKALIKLDPFQFISSPELVHKLLFSSSMDKGKLESYSKQLNENSLYISLGLFLSCRLQPRKVKIPVFVIGGEDDTLIHPKGLKSLAKEYNGQLYMCQNIAHDLMLDSNWINVASKILAWLKVHGL